MSSYYDDDRRRRRTRDYSPEDYDRGNQYRSSSKGRQISLVRRDSSPSSVEEVTRDFPPGDRGGYYREKIIRAKGHGPLPDRYNDNRSERDYKKTSKSSYDNRRDDRRDRRSRRYSSESYDSPSPPPRKHERKKSVTEEVLGALGLAGAAGALLGKKDGARSDSPGRSKSRSRRGRDRSMSSERSRGGKGRSKSVGRDQVIQALKAAGLAAAGEAFRARKEPGGWGGDKGKRIMTAAISAAGVDGLISNSRDPDKHSKRDVIGSALAGLATNRIVNGPRSKSRGPSPDGRGRSESRGGLGDLAAGGILAATGKKAYDKWRSRSRGRSRSRSTSVSSYDSRSPPRNKRRSQSVSAYAAKGLAALGLKNQADKIDPSRRPESRRYDDNDNYDDRAPPGGGNGYQESRDVSSRPRAGPDSMAMTGPNNYSLDYRPHHTGDPDTDSDSDLGSSSGEEKDIKSGKKRQLVTAGLAAIATIHAGHSVWQAKEKRDANRKALAEGDISKEEAKRSRTKQRWAEAGALGIAALGLKGAYSEWKEVQETRHEYREKQGAIERHRAKRENRRRKYEEEARRYRDSGYQGPLPSLDTYQNGYTGPGPYSASPAPHYYDDNPYGSAYAPSQPVPQQQYNHTDYPPPPGTQHYAPQPPNYMPPPQAYPPQGYPPQAYPPQAGAPYPPHTQ